MVNRFYNMQDRKKCTLYLHTLPTNNMALLPSYLGNLSSSYSHPISVLKKMHGHMDVYMVSIVSILSKKIRVSRGIAISTPRDSLIPLSVPKDAVYIDVGQCCQITTPPGRWCPCDTQRHTGAEHASGKLEQDMPSGAVPTLPGS